MIDDHDRYEWVNVFSGTGSPGLSWTKSDSRKMVVVVVCITLKNLTVTCNMHNLNQSFCLWGTNLQRITKHATNSCYSNKCSKRNLTTYFSVLPKLCNVFLLITTKYRVVQKKRGHSTFSQISRKLLKISK